jgi:hypothetical protein
MPRKILFYNALHYKEGFQINVFKKKCPTIYSQIFTVRLQQANIYLWMA